MWGMRKGVPLSVWGDEEEGLCICVGGMRKGVSVSVWGDEEGGPCICVWWMRRGSLYLCGG